MSPLQNAAEVVGGITSLNFLIINSSKLLYICSISAAFPLLARAEGWA